ncbi:transcriptional repressor [Synechococcales cyanobacterium C]|uniref:Transcriptional repressor n=1 Tax=Petrachloros mirabilis ULC683 TaxID=2781853 RepID=A0A8K2A102_9CYAN|nr:Fur family transcriptional regulator [Petrachloros mirabilis]NCJ07427.1 transcriptional repressor [Petrachloros mirabilis ULC683]
MTLKSANAIVQTLKAQGMRVTPQRYAVYANLLSRQDHPTVEQILVDLNREFPVSSQATVYSSLQALRDVGLVREVLLEEGVCRYDANIDPHHHFCCRHCDKIIDIPWSAFPGLDLSQFSSHIYAESYEVTVQGLCESCNESDVPTRPSTI